MSLLDLAHTTRQELNTKAKEVAGMSISQVTILSYIDLAGGKATISQLADMTQRVPHTITAKVNWLHEHGFVSKTRDPDDRRIIWVRVTAQGSRRLAAYRAGAAEILSSIVIRQGSIEPRTALDEVLASFGRVVRDDE